MFGDLVTFTATVTSSAGTPDGTVTFADNGSAFDSPVSLDSTGTATSEAIGQSGAPLGGGSHAITAVYSGSASYSGSSAGMTVIVNQATTALALASSENASVYGDKKMDKGTS